MHEGPPSPWDGGPFLVHPLDQMQGQRCGESVPKLMQ